MGETEQILWILVFTVIFLVFIGLIIAVGFEQRDNDRIVQCFIENKDHPDVIKMCGYLGPKTTTIQVIDQ
ncbi:MAG: hypothetical protein R3321_05545 [Nitrososphaeraceae archaeon]|nr:hypothetical protein [Nitrososphaeraceae archaeon]